MLTYAYADVCWRMRGWQVEADRLRKQVSEVGVRNEEAAQEYREHKRKLESATALCQLATTDSDSRVTMLQAA